MDVMGMSMDDKDSVLGLVAGILHLGNISFTENGNYAEIEDQGCKSQMCINGFCWPWF